MSKRINQLPTATPDTLDLLPLWDTSDGITIAVPLSSITASAVDVGAGTSGVLFVPASVLKTILESKVEIFNFTEFQGGDMDGSSGICVFETMIPAAGDIFTPQFVEVTISNELFTSEKHIKFTLINAISENGAPQILHQEDNEGSSVIKLTNMHPSQDVNGFSIKVQIL